MPVQLGDVHGFVSHSWSDDGAAKYEQLKKVWAGREDPESVMIWLDFIDQPPCTLSALPVFLSGKELVVLLALVRLAAVVRTASPATPRAWPRPPLCISPRPCVVELFTFLKMGGKREAIRRLNSATLPTCATW